MKARLILILFLASASSAGMARGPAAPPPAPARLYAAVPKSGPGEGPTASAEGPTASAGPAAARLPGFAAELADMPRIHGPRDWSKVSERQALVALARSTPKSRQRARWNYASGLIARARHADAVGVLDVMLQDDPDLALVANFQLARGLVLAQLDRSGDALEALARPELASNAEACLWRAQAFAALSAGAEALREYGCARSALALRSPGERAPFVAMLADAALKANKPDYALRLLSVAPDGDAAANILRGRAYLARGEMGEARIRLGRAERSDNEALRHSARLILLEMAVSQKQMSLADARKEIDHIRFVWRGGAVEEQALRLGYRLAKDAHDARGTISAGATLIRYFELGAELPPLLADVQAQISGLLAPGSRMPIDQAAGLYWDYRDLMPAGGEGDRLVWQLAERLQGAGLYARAAELLGHQLRHRAQDVAQGPLSVRVATLHILAGRPELALAAIRDTEGTILPQEMMWSRARVQAVALHQLGKADEAMAVIQDVPGANGLRSELLWRRRDWGQLVAASSADLPRGGALSEVKQAIVLRYAIALGMLGREAELAQLRGRYQVAFASLPVAPVFDLLTSEPKTIDPASLSQAMSAIPSASPAGEIADLLDIAPRLPQRG